jgi:hypothetical protein
MVGDLEITDQLMVQVEAEVWNSAFADKPFPPPGQPSSATQLGSRLPDHRIGLKG